MWFKHLSVFRFNQLPALDAPAALPDNVDGDTGEWTPPANSSWQPSESELAAIHAKEMAEANGDLLGDLPQ